MISITQSATSKIIDILKKNKKNFFRIGIKGGGCSGFQYIFSSEDHFQQDKEEKLSINNIDVLIDKKSIPYIKGSELDYVQEMIGSSFNIKNPNAKSACGCGTSFSI